MKIAVIGAGLMGQAIAWDMAHSREVEKVLLLDSRPSRLAAGIKLAANEETVETAVCDAADGERIRFLLRGFDAAVSCVPYRFNEMLTAECIRAGVHMCDLGGNNDVVDSQFAMNERAKQRGVTIIPDCGLAPGMASVWAMAALSRLDECDRVSIRCGGLPVEPQPPFNIMKLFSVGGLLNEYVEPCRILSDSEEKIVTGLSGLESLGFPKPFENLEAFYTSGGTSTLVRTLKGKVKNLDYKTVRYPGHCEIFRAMVAAGLTDQRSVLVDGRPVNPRRTLEYLLDRNLPCEGEDVTLLRVDALGTLDGQPTLVRYQVIDYSDSNTGLSAMQRCTGFPAGAIARMMADGGITQRGVVPQELAVPAERLMTELAQRNLHIHQEIMPSIG